MTGKGGHLCLCGDIPQAKDLLLSSGEEELLVLCEIVRCGGQVEKSAWEECADQKKRFSPERSVICLSFCLNSSPERSKKIGSEAETRTFEKSTVFTMRLCSKVCLHSPESVSQILLRPSQPAGK